MPKPRNVERDRAIGARICLARILEKLSRPTLGERIGVTYRQLARYERGEACMPASLLEDLGGALRREPAFFLGTDAEAVASVELLQMPEPGSIARRHLDQALAVLKGAVGLNGRIPFGSAAPAEQHGSRAA